MPKGTLKTREYYLACRNDKTRLQSLIETAQYKSVTVLEAAETLGLTLTSAEEAKLKELGVKLI